MEKEWEIKLDKEDVKLYLRTGGSKFDQKNHYTLCEVLLNE